MQMRVRNIIFILCGVAALLIKSRYAGPHAELVHSYLGNFGVSFAIYFLCANTILLAGPLLRLSPSQRRTATAALALAIVVLFEQSNGFGLMSNTYDPLDNAANAAGIALAVLLDALTAPLVRRDGPGNPRTT